MNAVGTGHSLRRRAAMSGALTLIATMMFAGPATARTVVDPATLNPAPPDFFNAVCVQIGRGTVCDLAFDDDDIVNEPSGIICGPTEILFSQSRSVVGKRFYDADGNITQRHFRESLSGTLSSPDTGKVVLWVQHDTVIHNVGVPGDLSTGTISFSGLGFRAWRPGGGTVLTDAGTMLRDQATDEVIRAGGRHPFEAYFVGGEASALQPLCDALE